MKRESEGGDTVRISEFANCSAFRTTHFCVCLCVCVNHSLIKTAAWAALQRVEFTKSIQAGNGRASLVLCLLSTSTVFLFLARFWNWMNIPSWHHQAGTFFACCKQNWAQLSAYILHIRGRFTGLCPLLSLRINCVLACNFNQTYFPPCSILLLLPCAVFLSC